MPLASLSRRYGTSVLTSNGQSMAHTLSSVPDLPAVGFARIEDQGYLNQAKDELSRTLQRDCHGHKFPGAQPISFTRQHIAQLKQRDYYLCEKSDGVRCLLFLHIGPEGQEMQFFIDRKNDFYVVPTQWDKTGLPGFHAPLPPPMGPDGKPSAEIDWASFHRGTVLDGELLYDTEPDGTRQLMYYVFDCLALDGDNQLMHRTLDKRLGYFMERVRAPYKALVERFPEDSQFIFQMKKKDFEFSYGVEKVYHEIMPRLKHGCDGLIFTCRETPYQFGTDENILKWKPAEENTVDFRMSLEFPPIAQNGVNGVHEEDGAWDRDYNAMPKFHLFMHEGSGEYTPFDDMYVEPQQWEDLKQYAVERNDGLDGSIVECNKDSSGRWRFNRWREDKNEGNHATVVQKVQQSIDDAVSKEELTKEVQEIRSAWKQRAPPSEQVQRRQPPPGPPVARRPA